MSVVISWSGERSQSVAEAVRDALSVGIQQSDPWMSSNDIPPGAFWGEELRSALEAASAGILCVTPENVAEPWILFEAGALAKGVGGSKSFACVLLIGLAPGELPGPLAQLQAVAADRDGFERIFDRINGLCNKPLKEDARKKAFGLVWPGLDAALKRVSSRPAPTPAKKRPDSDKIDEILGIVREVRKGTQPLGNSALLQTALPLFFNTGAGYWTPPGELKLETALEKFVREGSKQVSAATESPTPPEAPGEKRK
jgi:hypothetical protein